MIEKKTTRQLLYDTYDIEPHNEPMGNEEDDKVWISEDSLIKVINKLSRTRAKGTLLEHNVITTETLLKELEKVEK
jgi:hypothetical protein